MGLGGFNVDDLFFILHLGVMDLLRLSSGAPVSLEAILSELDQFSTELNRQSLKFLARAFTTLGELEGLPVECLCARLKEILCRHASTGKALDILQRMLVIAKYDSERVSKLSTFVGCSTFSLSLGLAPSSEIATKLSYHELLLIVSQKIDGTEKGTPVLEHLLGEIPEANIGSAKEEVKSVLHLFTYMLSAGTLTPSRPSTLNSELRNPLCTLRTKDRGVHKVIDDVVQVMDKNVQGKKNVGQWNDLARL